MNKLFKLLAMAVLAFGLGSTLTAAADFPALKAPFLLTSIGQSPDSNTLKVLAKKAKLQDVTYKTMATEADLAGVKTLLVSVGVSHKGFGIAGVNLETETARATALLDTAKADGIPIILIHIGGVGGRESLSEKVLEVVAPKGDAFIVYAEGNADGYFTEEAGDRPLVLVEKPIKVIDVFKEYASE